MVVPEFLKILSAGFAFSAIILLLQRKATLFKILVAILFVYYFGPLPTLLLTMVALGTFNISQLIFPSLDSRLAAPASFFILIQLYIFVGLLSTPLVGFSVVIVISAISIFFGKKIPRKIATFNFFEWWILSTAFIIASQPQTHWDAVHANLYNAKWYILNNSFAPLTESLSSLFPQNAIAYYSFFYKLGGLRLLQVSYVLPLIIVFVCLRKFQTQVLRIAPLLLFLPIIFFQSSNGYYDLLVLSLLLLSLVLLLQSQKKVLPYYLASFLIGFAGASKYFPLIYGIVPLALAVKNRFSAKHLLAMVALIIFPIILWMVRAFFFTGSPVFPFFQKFFSTPAFWPSGDILENNFMIQTALTVKQWLMGGFLVYPILTFFKSSQFLEATGGYTGIVFILLIPVQLYVYFHLLKTARYNLLVLSTLLCYGIVGIFTRYYRYLWPFQFIHLLFVLNYFYTELSPSFTRIPKKVIYSAFFVILSINIVSTARYFNVFPLEPRLYFKPDYYETSNNINHPMLAINSREVTGSQKRIFDASTFMNQRVHFDVRVYQCSWYLMGINKLFANTTNNPQEAINYLRTFDYLILNTKSTVDSARCPLFNSLVSKKINFTKGMKNIYTDSLYTVYARE